MLTETAIFSDINSYLSSLITNQLKDFLETGHLYQSFDLVIPDFDKAFSDCLSKDDNVFCFDKIMEDLRSYYSKIAILEWEFINPTSRKMGAFLVPQDDNRPFSYHGFIKLIPPITLHLFCSKCNAKEAFKLNNANSLLCSDHDENIDTIIPITQIFDLIYQCQLCNSLPEVLLLRRRGKKFRLEGRSPIEVYPIPNYIPKNQKDYFSDSLYAYNSNKTLAAYFYLRTFIEQYMRQETKFTTYESVEELHQKYKESLDVKFKSRCSISLYYVYQKLSEHIHSAIISDEVFDDARNLVELYFRELNLFDDMKANGIID